MVTAQGLMAAVLNSPWLVEAPSRCFRALFHHPEHGWRLAQILQRRGMSSFEVGVVRDVSTGNGDQLRAHSLTTLDAVVWLGIYMSDTEYSWDIVL